MKSSHKWIIVILVIIFFFELISNPTEIVYSPHSDIIGQYYYWKLFIQQSVTAFNELPLWNPHTFGGQPFIGNFHSELFYPLFVPFYVLPVEWVFGLMFMIHMILSGIAMTLLLKEYGIDNYSATVGSVVYIFSGYVITHLYAGHLSFLPTLLCVPLVFLFFERTMKLKSYWYATLTAAVIAIQFFGAHPQFFFYTVVMLVVYWTYTIINRYRQTHTIPRQLLLLFLCIGILSILLSSIQLLPALEFTTQSSRSLGVDAEFATKLSLPPWEIISFALPSFFGSPVDGTYWGRWNIWETNGYLGIITLLLVLIALKYQRNSHTYFFCGMSLFSVLFALGKYSPVYWLAYYVVPGFDLFRGPSKMLFFYTFAMAILAGIGTHAITQNKHKHLIKKIEKYGIMFSIILACVYMISLALQDYIIEFGKSVVTALFHQYKHTPALGEMGLPFFLAKVEIIFGQASKSLLTIIPLMILSIMVLRIRNVRYLKLALVFILVADLWIFGLPFIDTADPQQIFTPPEEISILMKDQETFRILDLDDKTPQSVAAQYNLQLLNGYDPMILGGYYDYASRIGIKNQGNARETIPIQKIVNQNMLNLLNVKYILSDERVPDFEHVAGRLHVNTEYLPRTFLVHNYISTTEVFRELQSPTYNPKEYAILEEDPHLNIATGKYKEVAVSYYSPNKIVLRNIEPGLLILSENFFPGWNAYADTTPVKIYKVNGIFRGMHLPIYTNELVIVYEPGSYHIGKWLTGIGMIIILTIGILRWKKQIN